MALRAVAAAVLFASPADAVPIDLTGINPQRDRTDVIELRGGQGNGIDLLHGPGVGRRSKSV